MSEQADQATVETSAQSNTPASDPVRRWTLIILGLCLVLLAWYLRADRITPYTTQARVHALVVPIAPEVAGTVTLVSVGNNQPVKAGQALFQIDVDRFQLALQTAEANLQSSRQALGASTAAVAAARASLGSANANLTRAKQDAVRMRAIRKEDPDAISERRLESAEASLAAAQGSLAAAEAKVEQAIQNRGTEGEANSRIQQSLAALGQAQLDLERATVRAPENGVVTGVRLDKGNFAAAGAPQMTFIATDRIWVQADFSENNLGNIDANDEVAIVFDMLPGQVIKGTIRDMGFGVAVDSAALGSLPTIDNDRAWLRSAQRFPVLIDFALADDENKGKLKVGSQASVVVYTGEHWLFNAVASVYMRLVSLFSYAY
ncbi:MAG: HlyD family secretion protein [Gammaproteobacteria bacterium]|nr:HlyD family secretion protein [Gammaproteobacteria bacterium]MBQ0839684.1 HlyD family secretion protein [Gammaproteobacteria bacterium]